MKARTFLLLSLTAVSFPAISAYSQDLAPAPTDYSSVKKDLAAFIKDQMGKHHVKGLSLALVDGSETVWLEGFGWADESKKVPATGETLYPIGAISELFTAVEIMRLVGEKKCGLDDDIHKHLPEFSINSRFGVTKPMTLRALLANHSGLPGFFVNGMWTEKPDNLSNFLVDLKTDYMASPPQTLYKYSYLDYDLLGRLIEIKRAKPFAEVMDEDVLLPLGMENSTFDDTPMREGKVAQGTMDGKKIPFYRLRDTPAAGMVSNAGDMAKFLQFFFAGGQAGKQKLLSPAAASSMFETQFPGLPTDFGQEVGLGWMLSGFEVEKGEKTAWRHGAFPPYFSDVAALPGKKIGLVLLSNSDEAQKLVKEVQNRALKLMLEAKDGVKRDLKEPEIKMPPEVKVPMETLERYAGFYSAFGQITSITKKGDHLGAEIIHTQVDLVPMSQDTFAPRLTILFFFPITLPQFPMSFLQAESGDYMLLKGLPFPVPFEKIKPKPIPKAWKDREGEYLLEEAGGETKTKAIEFLKISLEEVEGFLTVKLKVNFESFKIKNLDFKVALVPVSDEDAAVPGLFYGDGGTLHAVEKDGQTRIFYSGFWYVKKTVKP